MMARQGVDAFLVVASPLTNSERASLADLALQHHLPGVFVNRANVEAGGLMSYGPDFNYMYRHAAIYIDKILKGERPADLRSNRRLSTSWLSISRLQKPSALKSRLNCSPAPTR